MATNLYRVPSSTGSQTKFTLSFWWKNNSKQNSDKCFFSSGSNSSNYFMVRTTGNEEIQILNIDNGSQAINYKPNRYYRDANAWYHIVIAIDTTQAGGDRVKMYTNGVRETSFSSSTEPNQNANVLYVNDTTTHAIGRKNVTSDKYLEGTLSHYHFIDGTAYDASAFGSTDATTGEWKINTSPSVTYGTNGFFILKDGNSVTDQSGNGNNWQVGNGTLTNTEDNPSNVFATANPLQQNSTMLTFTNGNNTVAEPSGNSTSWTTRWGMSTLAFSSGKFYAEAKISDIGSQQLYPIGIVRDEDIPNINSSVGANGYGIYISDGRIIGFGNDIQTGLGSFSTNDIIGLAVDADNRTFQYYKNGSTLGSQVTNITAGTYFFTSSAYANHGIQFNFGNGYFGTTAITSAGSNGNGSLFEYDVPSGYYALNTKNINTYG